MVLHIVTITNTTELVKKKSMIVKGKFTLFFLQSDWFWNIYNKKTNIIIFRKSSINGKNEKYMSEDEFEFPKLMPIRA